MNTEVLIVGAGPTGLMLACQLLRFGVAFKIIDKQADRSYESRAFAIQAKSMEIFQNLGIADEFLALAIKGPPVHFFVDGKLKLTLNLNSVKIENTPFSSLFFLSQSETERILSNAIEKRGFHIDRQVSLETFQQTQDTVEAVLKNVITGETQNISCRYIVGCDGAHSTVRHILGIPFVGSAYDQSFFLADAKVTWPAPTETGFMAFFDRAGVFLHAPLTKDFTRILGSEIGVASQKDTPLTLEEITTLAENITHMKISIANPTWMARFHLHHRAVTQYQQGRAFLAGDSAHIHSPVGGQGMNTGLQDATNLAWKLAFALTNPSAQGLLTTYQLERQLIGKKLLETTDRFFGLMTSPNKILAWLRPFLLSLGMQFIARAPQIQRRAFWFMSQLGIHYPSNPYVYENTANADAQFLEGPKAGFRAPDAPIGASSLFEKLAESPCNILIFQTTRDDDKIQKIIPLCNKWVKCHTFILSADTDIIFNRYGISTAGLYFIRPDGYIGFRDSQLDPAALSTYLNKLFGHSPN